VEETNLLGQHRFIRRDEDARPEQPLLQLSLFVVAALAQAVFPVRLQAPAGRLSQARQPFRLVGGLGIATGLRTPGIEFFWQLVARVSPAEPRKTLADKPPVAPNSGRPRLFQLKPPLSTRAKVLL
jgi:hypothetical protein